MRSNTLSLRQIPRPALSRGAERLYSAAAALIIVPVALPIVRILTTRKAQRVLLAIAVFNIQARVSKHLFLREDALNLGSLGGLEISLTNMALIGLYLAWLVGIAIRSRAVAPQRRSSSKVTLPASLLLFFFTLSLFAADDLALGVFLVCSVLVQFLLYWYVAQTTISRDDLLFIVRILLIGLILQSIFMLAQSGGLIGDIDAFGIKAQAEFGGENRVSGTLGSPSHAAAYLAMMMVFALGVMLADVGKRDKYLASAGLAAATLPLILTLSRGGWISFFVGLAALVIFGGRRVPKKAVAAAVVALILLAIPFRGVISERLYGDDNGSAASRMPLNDLATAMIADHPLLGVGANNFALAMEPYRAHSFSGDFFYTVHNTYLLVWTETGIGGLIALVWFLVAVVRQGSRCWKSRDPLLAPLALGCVAAVAGLTVHMNFEPFGSGPAVDVLWLFAGLVTAMARLSVSPLAVSRVMRPASTAFTSLSLGQPVTNGKEGLVP
jgi:putative inorganic carbon (hco3(-)) transporter